MIDPKDANAANAIKCFGEMIDAIPKGKRANVIYQMCVVEITMKDSFRLLKGFRQYILETPAWGGEASPFVQQIDRLIPREKVSQAPTGDTDDSGDSGG